MQRKIAVLGITGDPITLGHQQTAEAVGNSNFFDEVWIQPCWKHRLGKKPIHESCRMTMCIITVSNLGKKYISSFFEINNSIEGGTYILHQKMKEAFPDVDFYHIIGMDNANDIHKWANWEKLIKEVPFVVCHRKGIEKKVDWFEKQPHIYLPTDCVEISSTDIRKMFEDKDSKVSEYLNPEVLRYIKDFKLYGQ